MQIKPYIILLYLLSVFTVLLLVSFTFYLILPANESKIKIAGNFGFVFPKTNGILKHTQTQYVDISNILAENTLIADTSSVITSDTLTMVSPDTVNIKVDTTKPKIQLLEFPTSDHSTIYPVFREMESARKNHRVVRIIHYGDSQIEGDRITSFLRNRIQKKFGGNGVGLIPARQVYDFKYSLFQDASDNWHRYTLYGSVDKQIKHNRYGILASFSSFTGEPFDTILKSENPTNAWISIKASPYSYRNTKKFNQCRLFYGYNEMPFSANLFVNGELVDSGTYSASGKLKQIHWNFNDAVNDIKIELKGKQSPEVYCLALDGKSGVAVDNVAMRGCAGLVFTKMNPVLFSELVKKLDVKLMILQFGGNIVPNIRKDYSYYEKWFYAQLNFIRQNAPDVQIIVIGVSDMSMKQGDSYVTYPNLVLVRDALKKATFRANAIYWDMFEAMGGENSMPSWVLAKPPLAGSDFVHFNPKGAQIIANMFYNALMYEYELYKMNESEGFQNNLENKSK